MARPFTITIDAADPRRLGEFWQYALGYVMEPPPSPFQTWPEALDAWGVPKDARNSAYAIVDPQGVGPRILLQQVPERKSEKNRVHLDVHSGAGVPGSKDMAIVHAIVEDLVDRGAKRGEEFNEATGQWVVMQDPEGNEFCVV